MYRKKKTSQTFQPQVGLSSTELLFFLFKSLLNRLSMQNLLISPGQLQEKNGHSIREKNPLQRFALFSCGQVCRIGSVVRSGICFCTILWLSVGSSVMPVAAGAALSVFLLLPWMPLPGLVCHVLFRAGRQLLRVLAVYIEMCWKELTFQETHPSFLPATLLLCPQGAVHPGSALEEIKDQAAIHCFLFISLNILLRCS